MSVKPSELEMPERGLNLVTRDGPEADRPAKRRHEAEIALEGIRERVEAARALPPPEKGRHCGDCWTKGRDAAILAIEGTKTT